VGDGDAHQPHHVADAGRGQGGSDGESELPVVVEQVGRGPLAGLGPGVAGAAAQRLT
jgi:hypothetical protein